MPESNNGSGKRKTTLFDTLTDPFGLVYPFNPKTHEIYFLGPETVIAEATGMVGSGKDKHIKIAVTELPQDPELVDVFGRPIRVRTFKPNNLIKQGYEKNTETRAILDRLINRNTASLLESLAEMRSKGDSPFTPVELDLVLLNRGPYDNIRWTRALYDYGFLSREDMERNTGMANEVLEYISLVANFSIPVDEAIRRESRRESKSEEEDLGKVMGDRRFLEILQGHYEALSKEISTYGHPLGFGEDVECIYIDGMADLAANSRRFMGALRTKLLSSAEERRYRGESEGADPERREELLQA